MTVKERFKNDLYGFIKYLIEEKELNITTPYDYACELIRKVELDPVSILDLHESKISDVYKDDMYVFVSNYDSPFSFSSVNEFYEMIDRDYHSYEIDLNEFDEEYNGEYDNYKLNIE